MTGRQRPEQLFYVTGLSTEDITKIAFETEFCKRKSGKIKPPDFLLYFCLESLKGTVSYNDIAAKIAVQTGTIASRQAYSTRMGKECEAFFHKILEAVMRSKMPTQPVTLKNGLREFKRILVQDSTIIRLPLRLFDEFSGIKNATTAVCNARIQGVYDLISRQFMQFAIDRYSQNDLSATLDLEVQEGDLILRDRGYYSIKAMKFFHDRGAESISRYKHKTKLYDPDSGKEIDLLEHLKKFGMMNMIVLAGENEKFKMRIIAAPCTEEITNIRRMKAKKENKGRNPSQDILALMSWSIFMHTMSEEDIPIEIIMMLYGLRWRIENIFKTWKSNFRFDKIHNVSALQLAILLKARLIMITFIHNKLYNPFATKIREISNKVLSMMKFMRYISKNPEVMQLLVRIDKVSQEFLEAIIRFCTYDSRKRKTFEDSFKSLFADQY